MNAEDARLLSNGGRSAKEEAARDYALRAWPMIERQIEKDAKNGAFSSYCHIGLHEPHVIDYLLNLVAAHGFKCRYADYCIYTDWK